MNGKLVVYKEMPILEVLVDSGTPLESLLKRPLLEKLHLREQPNFRAKGFEICPTPKWLKVEL